MKWILKLLSHHPDVQEKLRTHLKQRVDIDIEGGTELTFDDVRAENVPYLEAVIWESLRMSQIGLFVSRMGTCILHTSQ
jgi:cytochrome P450